MRIIDYNERTKIERAAKHEIRTNELQKITKLERQIYRKHEKLTMNKWPKKTRKKDEREGKTQNNNKREAKSKTHEVRMNKGQNKTRNKNDRSTKTWNN